MILLRPARVPRDAETMCPETGPSRVTAILVDTTDRVGPVSRADILGRLDDLVSASRPDEMMIAYATSPIEDAGDPLPPRLTVCNPGDPDAANPLIANPELIRQRLDERFRNPLDLLFRDLLNRAPAPESPLMENIQVIAVTVLGRYRYAGALKRLVVVSDLIQHSENLSLFRQRLDFDAFVRTTGADALRTELQNVEVEILFIQRDEHQRVGDSRRLIEFWERWIDAQGGRLVRASRIDGLN